MELEIITPEKTIYKGFAKLIQMPGIDGLFEVLENHAPMIASLQKGKVKIEDSENKVQYFDINGGIVEILHNKVLILA